MIARVRRFLAGRAETAARAGLALGRDDAPLHLDWIVAAMSFIGALALLAALAVADLGGRWERGLTGALTVEIPAADTVAADTARLQRALEIVRAEPGIARAEPITTAKLLDLLAPWLGAGAVAEDLPLPQLIDVTLSPGGAIDLAGLRRKLAGAVDRATVDDHGVWLGELLRLIRFATALAGAIVALVTLTAMAAIVLATRVGLAIHRDAVDLLHMIGAEDIYIARQFADQALRLGLRGGALGFVAAAGVIVAAGVVSQSIDRTMAPSLWPSVGQALALLLVPAGAAGLAWITAQQTVLRVLRRMA